MVPEAIQTAIMAPITIRTTLGSNDDTAYPMPSAAIHCICIPGPSTEELPGSMTLKTSVPAGHQKDQSCTYKAKHCKGYKCRISYGYRIFIICRKERFLVSFSGVSVSALVSSRSCYLLDRFILWLILHVFELPFSCTPMLFPVQRSGCLHLSG